MLGKVTRSLEMMIFLLSASVSRAIIISSLEKYTLSVFNISRDLAFSVSTSIYV